MTEGARVEAVIVWTVRAALALLMLPLILVYAVLAGLASPMALLVTTARPVARRPLLGPGRA